MGSQCPHQPGRRLATSCAVQSRATAIQHLRGGLGRRFCVPGGKSRSSRTSFQRKHCNEGDRWSRRPRCLQDTEGGVMALTVQLDLFRARDCSWLIWSWHWKGCSSAIRTKSWSRRFWGARYNTDPPSFRFPRDTGTTTRGAGTIPAWRDDAIDDSLTDRILTRDHEGPRAS